MVEADLDYVPIRFLGEEATPDVPPERQIFVYCRVP
jgi:hypothetical protein